MDEVDVKATPPWEISINDRDRYPGQDVTEEIEEGCEIYYRSPDGIKLRSRTGAINYFMDNPHPTLSPMQLC